MHKPSIAQLVYRTLFPRPRSTDPNSLSAHITRNIVPEVRIETANFYGALDCIEAQYPGLDYTSTPHRRRLCRFPHHKKLFKAFDELGLTNNEILSLCQWEGTKSAKDKYERDAGQPIRDTTMDGVALSDTTDRLPRATFPSDQPSYPISADRTTQQRKYTPPDSETSDAEHMSDEDESTHTSIGVSLNQQLIRAADARARGEPAVFDEQFEEWMKEALERSEMTPEAVMQSIRGGRPFLSNQLQSESFNAAATTVGSSDSATAPAQANIARQPGNRTRGMVAQFHSTLHNLQAMSAQMNADTAALAATISRNPTEAAR